MTTPEERASQIAKIAALPEVLAAAVADLSDAQLDTPYRAGGWTVRQVVHHLADSHMNAYIRQRLMVTEDHPTLKPYDQDAWAALPDASSGPVEHSLALLRGLHARWASFLNALPETAWGRTAHHPENGEVVLYDTLGYYARHGENHVGQIRDLRTRQGW